MKKIRLFFISVLAILSTALYAQFLPTALKIKASTEGRDTVLIPGQISTFEAVVTPTDNTAELYWASSDTNIIMIDSLTGKISAKAVGTANITLAVTADNTVKDVKEITVKAPNVVNGYSMDFNSNTVSKMWFGEHNTDTVPVFKFTQNNSELKIEIDKMGPLNADKSPSQSYKTAIYGFSALRLYFRPDMLVNFAENPFISVTMKTSNNFHFEVGINSVNTAGNPVTVADSIRGNDYRTYIFKFDSAAFKGIVDSSAISNLYLNFNPGYYAAPSYAGDFKGTVTIKEFSIGKNVIPLDYLNYVKLISPQTYVAIGNKIQLLLDKRPLFQVKDSTITWSVNDANIATVSTTGEVTGVANGKVTVYATAMGGVKDSVSLDVIVPVSKITISSASGSNIVIVGKTLQLNAVIEPADASNKELVWTSSNANNLIDDNGLFSAGMKNNVTVTATAKDGSGVKATFIVRVQNIEVTSIVISSEKNATQLEPLGTMQLVATVAPDSATSKEVTWAITSPSDASGYASIDANGLVSCEDFGISITVTATSKITTSKSATFIIELVEKVGLDKNWAENIQVFPSPVKDKLTIKNLSDVKTIQVINFIGIVLENVSVKGNEVGINTSNLSEGIYLVKFTSNNNETSVIKISKK